MPPQNGAGGQMTSGAGERSPGATTDWIGPPDVNSRLRPIRLHIPPEESNVERRFRAQREAVARWNQDFWAHHNRAYNEEQKAFIARLIRDKQVASADKIDADKMSDFYKSFLDDRRKELFEYNWRWYAKNFGLIFPAFQVCIIRMVRGLRSRLR